MSRRVLLHLDDLGLCAGANDAFLDLSARGAITCGSVMVPAPAFGALADAAARRDDLDIGVHLTLTAEWRDWRWRPLSTTRRASGLLDADGYFPRTVRELQEKLVVEAAEAELRAQIDRALASGIDVTHLDAHMGCTMLPELMPCYARLAHDYRLPLFVMRKVPYVARSDAAWQASIEALERQGLPIVDHVLKTLKAPAADPEAAYRAMFAGIADGLTCVLLHCCAPGEIETIAPDHAVVRTAEYALFRSGVVGGWLARRHATPTGFRELRRAWRAAHDPSHAAAEADYIPLAAADFLRAFRVFRDVIKGDRPATTANTAAGDGHPLPRTAFAQAWQTAGLVFDDETARASFYRRFEKLSQVAKGSYGRYVDEGAGPMHIVLLATIASVPFGADTPEEIFQAAFDTEFRKHAAALAATSRRDAVPRH